MEKYDETDKWKLLRALKKTKRRKSLGMDGITVKSLKIGDCVVKCWLSCLLNARVWKMEMKLCLTFTYRQVIR